MSDRLYDEVSYDEVSFDVLGDVLETLRFRGSIFFRSQLAALWGMSLESSGTPRFHIPLSGDCFFGAEDQEAVKVGEMDIVMLPTGSAHWIADQPGLKLIPSQLAAGAYIDSQGARIRLVAVITRRSGGDVKGDAGTTFQGYDWGSTDDLHLELADDESL